MSFEKIKELALKLGVDDVRFLNLKDYHSPLSPDPTNYLPEAQSLVVLVLRELRGSYLNRSIIKMYGAFSLDITARDIGYRMSKFIEDNYDSDAFMIPDHRPFEITKETRKQIIGPVSLRHAAVQCGLGVMGRNNLVVNPRWGSFIRIGAILTNLSLPSDPALKDYNPCSACSYQCWKKCPAGAIQGDKTHQNRCTAYSQPYDVGNYMRFLLKWEDMSKEERKEFLQTPHWFNLYMAGMGYMYYRCTECTRGCPGEKHRDWYSQENSMVGYATTLNNPEEMSFENLKVK